MVRLQWKTRWRVVVGVVVSGCVVIWIGWDGTISVVKENRGLESNWTIPEDDVVEKAVTYLSSSKVKVRHLCNGSSRVMLESYRAKSLRGQKAKYLNTSA